MAAPSVDALAIATLLKRERFYRDTAQWELCRAAFHPQASATYINVAWYEGEVEEFLRRSAQMHKGKVNIIHSGFDPVDIRIAGRRAISEAFCHVTSSVTLNDSEYELASHMRLFTRLEKMEDTGEWHMLSLESAYVRDRLVAAVPGPAPLEIPEHVLAHPKPYRLLALVMSSRGLSPRADLPHEDDPDSVRRISNHNKAYLNGNGADIYQ